jgi:hypothetical protein
MGYVSTSIEILTSELGAVLTRCLEAERLLALLIAKDASQPPSVHARVDAQAFLRAQERTRLARVRYECYVDGWVAARLDGDARNTDVLTSEANDAWQMAYGAIPPAVGVPAPAERPIYEVERDRHGLMYSGPLQVGECVRVTPVGAGPVPAAETTGVGLIAAERERQVQKWSARHDDTHRHYELEAAAICYAMPASARGLGTPRRRAGIAPRGILALQRLRLEAIPR